MENTMRINRLPAITWNRMDINDVCVTWPELEASILPLAQGAKVDVPTGAGAQADAVFAHAGSYGISANKGETRQELVELNAGAAVLTLSAGENSDLTVFVQVKGQEKAPVALRLLLELEENAKIRLVELLCPGQEGRLLHDVGGNVGKNARVEVLHLYLGKGDLYSGCRMELIGDGAAFEYEAGYLEQGTQTLDVNLIANHIGKNTTCQLRADGTLKDSAKKTFRGTIDFKRGAKGSVGAETENVLLLGENVVNKTIPLILCAEEDVQGDHGASIGELDEETLFFFASRGIDPLTAENLLTREKLYRLSQKMGREDITQAAEKAIEEVL